MRFFKKTLKVSAIFLGSLVLLATLAALTLLRWPQIVLNPTVLEWAQPHLGKFGVEAEWEGLKIDVDSPGWLHKRILLGAERLCVRFASGTARGCFSPLELKAEVAYHGGFRLLSVGPIRISGRDIRYEMARASETQETKSNASNFELAVPKLFRETRVDEINIDLQNVEVVQGKTLFSGNLTLEAVPGPVGSSSLRLVAEKTCVAPPGQETTLCAEKLDLQAAVRREQGLLQIERVGPIQLANAELNYDSGPPIPKPQGGTKLELSLPELVLPEGLRGTRFEPIDLQFSSLKITQEGNVSTGRAEIHLSPDASGHPSRLALDATLSGGPISGKMEAQIFSASGFLENDWVLTAKTQSRLSTLSLDATARLSQTSPKHFQYGVSGSFQRGAVKGRLEMSGDLSPGRLQAFAAGEAGGFSKAVHKISTQRCRLSLQEIPTTESRGHISLDCPVRAHLTPVRLPSPSYEKFVTIPYNLDFIVKTEMEGSLVPSMDRSVDGTLDVELVPLSEDLLRARGTTHTRFSGIPSSYPQGWKIVSDLDMFLEMPQFQKLVKALDRTAFPIFAPLGVLEGSVELGLSGQADIARNRGKLPIAFKTRLQSKEEKFSTDGKGELDYQLAQTGDQSKLQMDLELSDLQLALPSFGLSSLPNVFPDPRLSKRRFEPPKASGKFDYEVKIHTPKERPARLVSNLSKENIPVNLDVTAVPGKLTGNLNVANAAIQFFRRKAEVQKFSLQLAEPVDLSPIDARFRIAFSDVKIDVILLGTVKRPRIIFESDPPMEQEQIISTLIYGRTYDSLDETQSNSVGGVAGAASDRALTLASLFLLASTPIERISYNPVTRDFSAKVRLAEGTSLSVGTTEGKTQQLGVKKALGKNWIINTYIENDSEHNQQKGAAFLEYYKRY